MDIPVLVINLDRSPDRWDGLSARAAELRIVPERVAAMDGNALQPHERKELDVRKFQLWHGRRPMGGEYGCYMSHLRALRRVAEAEWPFAVILEDDADFLPDFAARVEACTRLSPQPDIVKLYNHRTKGFIHKVRTDVGDSVGRCIHGPMGSSMGYLVSLEGARKLLARTLPMFLPFDIALERDWAHGARVYVTQIPLLKPASRTSTIGGYSKTKFPFYMRLPTALFRGQDYIRRALYAAFN
ncbi:glycosyltransferase family 25 protein [Chelativorans sp. Marseille-P2723]|uniref:glycosyltransferase family 25 protein n=1 Tax=Chelativorans sp. Marseille-P2723 TaxID=2709133 RepID=UPI00156E9099|nr:glycosyltransferase family 25 protein [Chelativorans sp. Marseille-P2723]